MTGRRPHQSYSPAPIIRIGIVGDDEPLSGSTVIAKALASTPLGSGGLDVSGTTVRLPWRLRAGAELEYVGRKPLGDGFTAVPVRDIRGSLTRSFSDGLFDTGVHFLSANGYSGQTLQTMQLAGEASPFERIVGVRKASWAGITLSYHFRRMNQ